MSFGCLQHSFPLLLLASRRKMSQSLDKNFNERGWGKVGGMEYSRFVKLSIILKAKHCHLDQRVPCTERVCGSLLLQAWLLRRVSGNHSKQPVKCQILKNFVRVFSTLEVFWFLIHCHSLNQEVLAVYLQNFPDSAIAINLKACNHFRWSLLSANIYIIYHIPYIIYNYNIYHMYHIS